MNITKYTYRLDESRLDPVDINCIDSIALHHMEHATAGINDVTSWHMDENGWDWIGYGYWIALDGTRYECRGYKYINAGVKGHNGHVLSIGFQGDYSKPFEMPQVQFASGVELIRHLKSKLPNVKTIAGHNYWNDTKCPGEYFPLVKMIRGIEVVKLNIDEALKIFQDNDIINSLEYWKKVIDTTNHFSQLVINVATKIQELKVLTK